jgi:hypothetical protein
VPAVWSPRLKRNIGYVWVPVELAADGTALRVEWPFGGSVEARVVPLPLHRSEEGRPGGPPYAWLADGLRIVGPVT